MFDGGGGWIQQDAVVSRGGGEESRFETVCGQESALLKCPLDLFDLFMRADIKREKFLFGINISVINIIIDRACYLS